MKVILKQDVKGSGKKGDIIEVNDGYANNFLIKKNLAEKVNTVNMLENESQKAAQQHKKDLEKQAAVEISNKIKALKVVIKLKIGENGKVFGSVTSKEICDKLNELGANVLKQQLVVPNGIKALGIYEIEAKLYAGVSVKFNLFVEGE